MEQFEVVFKPVEGYEHVAIKGENGELIVRLVPNVPETSQGSETCSQSRVVEEATDKAKYFVKITAEDREKVKKWLAKQTGKTEREKSFLSRVEDAIKVVNYDYWIATMEPSVENGKIYYAEGKKVGVGFSCNQYRQMATQYAPKRASRLANLHELFIWYALRIANGWWTLNYVANDSSSAGNYCNAPDSAQYMEKTGARGCGGYSDGQGNTYKIVTCVGSYAMVGACCKHSGRSYPAADVDYNLGPDNTLYDGSGVLVLTK